ncbi:MAG: hypothetical protein LPK21_18010, partial [Hymenobacteraceae bacterium]|nr:hypothetical protein [Hymenobacteraceae bacterium]MDX5514156.1 hypothetical protein [Hymenobacteraceae bacterium]
IIYDSNCNVGIGLRELMLALGLIKTQECIAFANLPDQYKVKVDPERFRNEMALIDKFSAATLYGADGIAYIFSEKIPPLRFLFRLKLFFLFFRFLYKTIANNRYIIAPPKQTTITCNCYPDNVKTYRIAYIILTYTAAVLLTALFGISVKNILKTDSGTAAIYMLLMAGTGWLIHLVVAYIKLSKTGFEEYAGHIGSIMVAGLLVLVPSISFSLLFGFTPVMLPLISVCCSSGFMLWLHAQRARYLQLPSYFTTQWFLLLQACAAFWIIYLYF